MAEEKKCECCEKEELDDKELDEVAGGFMRDGVWHCDYCGKADPSVNSVKGVQKHLDACDQSPFYKKK